MSRLTPHESRVLGVLVEKAQTTPGQYPMTLNSLLAGANQRSNRDPVLNLTEDEIQTALDGLRMKNLVREVMLSGSRVAKYRHVARETLDISTSQLVVLAELLLRGPQTVGEIRGRASRMHPLESVEATTSLLEHLIQRDPPFIAQAPPAPASRAPRFYQLLCPDLHPLHAPTPPDVRENHPPTPARDLDHLEAKIHALEHAVRTLAAELDLPDPLPSPTSTPPDV